MKKLLVLALILVSASAFAQTSNMPNGIGVYFDQNGINNYLPTAPMYVDVYAYLVATNITQSAGLSAWEAEVAINPFPVAGVTYTMAGGGTNVLDAPNYQVGVAPSMPYAPAMLLLTMKWFCMGVAAQVSVGPCTPTSFPVLHTPGYVDGLDPTLKLPLFEVATSMPLEGRDYFYIMAGLGLPAPEILTVVGTENNSWSSVKSLYQ